MRRLGEQKRVLPKGVALGLLDQIGQSWSLTEVDMASFLGFRDVQTLHEWSNETRVERPSIGALAVLEQIAMLIGIFCTVARFYETSAQQLEWLQTPSRANPFNGGNPKSVLLRGRPCEIEAVLTYVNAASTGLFMAPNEIDRDFVPYTDDNIRWS